MHPRISTRQVDTREPHVLVADPVSERLLVIQDGEALDALLDRALADGLLTGATLRNAPLHVTTFDFTGAYVGQLTTRLQERGIPHDYTTLTEDYETTLVASARRRRRARQRAAR